MLMDEFVVYDVYKSSVAKSHSLIKSHITSGKYDKQRQIAILLGDEERCKQLLAMTMDIDMEWRYLEYC